MQDLIRAADLSLIKLPLKLTFAFYNVDSVAYVMIDNIMLPYYILYRRKALRFSFTMVTLF